MGGIEGRRVLVVEDDVVVALVAEEMLLDLGAVVVGPAHDVATARALVAREAVDAAVLDVNLGRERSDAVAEDLRARAIPFVIATGTDGDWGADAVVVEKPYSTERLARALAQALAARDADPDAAPASTAGRAPA